MLPIVILSLFPNLHYFYPANVEYLTDSLILSGSLWIRDCKQEIQNAHICIANLNHQYNVSDSFKPTTFFAQPSAVVVKYSADVLSNDCLANNCSSVQLIHGVYVDAAKVVQDIYKVAYDCLEKENSTIRAEVEKCEDTYSFAHHLKDCSLPIIQKLDCTENAVRALTEAVETSIAIDERTFRSSGIHLSIFSCIISVLLVEMFVL